MRPMGMAPVRVNDSRARASKRLNIRPNGSSVASIRLRRIWWARVIDVAAAMASTAPQPLASQLRRASAIGSKGRGASGGGIRPA